MKIKYYLILILLSILFKYTTETLKAYNQCTTIECAGEKRGDFFDNLSSTAENYYRRELDLTTDCLTGIQEDDEMDCPIEDHYEQVHLRQSEEMDEEFIDQLAECATYGALNHDDCYSLRLECEIYCMHEAHELSSYEVDEPEFGFEFNYGEEYDTGSEYEEYEPEEEGSAISYIDIILIVLGVVIGVLLILGFIIWKQQKKNKILAEKVEEIDNTKTPKNAIEQSTERAGLSTNTNTMSSIKMLQEQQMQIQQQIQQQLMIQQQQQGQTPMDFQMQQQLQQQQQFNMPMMNMQPVCQNQVPMNQMFVGPPQINIQQPYQMPQQIPQGQQIHLANNIQFSQQNQMKFVESINLQQSPGVNIRRIESSTMVVIDEDQENKISHRANDKDSLMAKNSDVGNPTQQSQEPVKQAETVYIRNDNTNPMKIESVQIQNNQSGVLVNNNINSKNLTIVQQKRNSLKNSNVINQSSFQVMQSEFQNFIDEDKDEKLI